MAEQDWTPSKVMQGHLQNLMNQGFMMAVELPAYRVPGVLTFPTSADGYVVTVTEFYERGFGAPSHQFIHSFLWYYVLELHNLTPSGVLHMGDDPEFDLWNYFYHVRCL
jgi:hypothetical protein